MSVVGLKKAIARLEEPLFNPAEHDQYALKIESIANSMKQFANYEMSATISVTHAPMLTEPLERNDITEGVAAGSIGLLATNGVPQSKMKLQKVNHSAINKDFIYDMYPRAYGAAGDVAVFFCDVSTVGANWQAMTNLAIWGMTRAQVYFDWPIAAGYGENGTKVQGWARFRAKVDEEAQTYKVIGLCRPTFLDPEPPSAPIKVIDTLTLNIGEFPTGYLLTSEQLIRGYLAALDGVIDLGIGFDYDCKQCNVSYSALDPGSSDRALVATLGYCRTCLSESPASFPDAVPAPW
ncbi:hypothetical protein SEA_DIABLA_75 [Gordonia phage Diabla]|nr:hypothetical protein SEA_DIABLA_75 [Gordonia phage Diabla]